MIFTVFHNSIKHTVIFSLFATQIFLTGCVSRNREDTSLENNTNEPNTEYSEPSSQVNTFQSNAGNLFETTINNDPPPANNNTNTQTNNNNSAYSTTPMQPTSQEIACLGGSAPSNSGYYTQNPGLSACVQPSSQHLDEDYFFNTTVQSYESMSACYEHVRTAQQRLFAGNAALSPEQTKQAFKAGRMALVRCFRGILRNQMQAAQWNRNQYQNFSNVDTQLWTMLREFGIQY